MNAFLLSAAALTLAVAAAHSYLGERFILVRLFRRPDLPKLFGGDDFTRRTLRLAWHITSVLAVGLAALILTLPRGGAGRSQAAILSAAMAGSGLVSLVVSRGKHLSWVAFFAIAACVWLGSR